MGPQACCSTYLVRYNNGDWVQAPPAPLAEFSSPFVVKVKKFTEQHHRVEVNLGDWRGEKCRYWRLGAMMGKDFYGRWIVSVCKIVFKKAGEICNHATGT